MAKPARLSMDDGGPLVGEPMAAQLGVQGVEVRVRRRMRCQIETAVIPPPAKAEAAFAYLNLGQQSDEDMLIHKKHARKPVGEMVLIMQMTRQAFLAQALAVNLS